MVKPFAFAGASANDSDKGFVFMVRHYIAR